jgi:hypothetical protein
VLAVEVVEAAEQEVALLLERGELVEVDAGATHDSSSEVR